MPSTHDGEKLAGEVVHAASFLNFGCSCLCFQSTCCDPAQAVLSSEDGATSVKKM